MVLNSNGTFIETNNYTAIPTGSSTSTPGACVSSGTYTSFFDWARRPSLRESDGRQRTR